MTCHIRQRAVPLALDICSSLLVIFKLGNDSFAFFPIFVNTIFESIVF